MGEAGEVTRAVSEKTGGESFLFRRSPKRNRELEEVSGELRECTLNWTFQSSSSEGTFALSNKKLWTENRANLKEPKILKLSFFFSERVRSHSTPPFLFHEHTCQSRQDFMCTHGRPHMTTALFCVRKSVKRTSKLTSSSRSLAVAGCLPGENKERKRKESERIGRNVERKRY